MALEQGLGAGLEQLAARMMETYEQKVEVTIDPQADRMLDSQAIQTLFSIAQETVNNARNHAKSDTIFVRLAMAGEELVMEVSDQGIGFDVNAALAAARTREGHMGLINLQERARLIEGALDLWSEPGNGSRTTISIPVETLRARKVEEANRATEGQL